MSKNNKMIATNTQTQEINNNDIIVLNAFSIGYLKMAYVPISEIITDEYQRPYTGVENIIHHDKLA